MPPRKTADLRLLRPDARPLHGASAYEALCAEIRSGALPPGARLLESEIAARLNVSRTPVREAIRRLEAEGLVDHEPRSGAVVRRLDYAEIMELYEMRTVLEGTAARLAARAASPAELDELQAINDEMAEVRGPDLARLNRQFHLLLCRSARNRFLLRSTESIDNTLLILGPSSMEQPARAKKAVREHRAVLAALLARDGKAAEAAMRAHLEQAQRTRLRMLREGPTDPTAAPDPEAADD